MKETMQEAYERLHQMETDEIVDYAYQLEQELKQAKYDRAGMKIKLSRAMNDFISRHELLKINATNKKVYLETEVYDYVVEVLKQIKRKIGE